MPQVQDGKLTKKNAEALNSHFMNTTIEQLAALIQEQQRERYLQQFPDTLQRGLDTLLHQATKTEVIEGKKYTKINVGSSGKYMIDISTGDIYGIKGYGVIHKGHHYGTLDTINAWNWGGYTARKIQEMPAAVAEAIQLSALNY